jgi:hypothetical protein
MARIELRDATIRIKDGLSGSGVINDTPGVNDTNVDITTVNLNTTVANLVPVGARFTVNTVNNVTTYVVTARTPANAGPTTNVTFTPLWGAVGTPANADVLTFAPCQIDIKIGEGNLKYTENKDYNYMLDRGDLDTVREGDEKPLDVSLEFVYEFVTTGTSEAITPVDALKQQGGADEWVSSSADPCEPYAVDIEIDHEQPCGTAQDETTILPDFRYEKLEFSLKDATISVTGKCNASSATVTRI